MQMLFQKTKHKTKSMIDFSLFFSRSFEIFLLSLIQK